MAKYLYICEFPSGSMVDRNLERLCDRVRDRFKHLIEWKPEALSKGEKGLMHKMRLHALLDHKYLERNVFDNYGFNSYPAFIFPVNELKHVDMWDVIFTIRRMPL